MPRILGIDPGIGTIGYAIVEEEPLTVIDYGVITTPSDWRTGLRLEAIEVDVLEIIKLYQPQKAAVEMPFFREVVSNTIIVHHGLAATRLAISKGMGIEPLFYHQSSVKAAVARGGASKEEVLAGVEQIFGIQIPESAPDDAVDAIAVCYAYMTREPAKNTR